MIITRSLDNATIEVNKPRRMIRAIIGSESVDRHRTVIDPAGVDFTNFKLTAAVVPWAHDKDPTRGQLPIGNCSDIGLTTFKGRSVLLADTEFWDDAFSATLFDAYASRKLNGWSVTVLDRGSSPPSREEVRARPELSDCKVIFRRTELTNYSATATPSNVDATTVEIFRSLSVAADARGVADLPASADDIGSLISSELRLLASQIRADRERIFRQYKADLCNC